MKPPLRNRNHIDKLGAVSLARGLGHMNFLVNLKLNLNESLSFKLSLISALRWH